MSGDHNANQKAVSHPTLGEYLRGLRLCQNEMSLERMPESSVLPQKLYKLM